MYSMTWTRLPAPPQQWKTALVFLLGLILTSVAPLAAQEVQEIPAPGEALYHFVMVDGVEVVARVAEVDGSTVILITPAGIRMEVEAYQIREIHLAEGRVVDGQYWREDPNLTRLFFTATGRALDAGEAYAGTYFIVLPFVAVGVTDRFTLAAGAPVLFGEFEPFYIAPKFQVIRVPGLDASLGTLVFFFDDENVGIAYGVATFGDSDGDRALTLGLGFGFSGADFSNQPVAMIGGETRISRRIKLLTENYFLPGDTGFLYSAGLRFIGDRFSTDVGLAGVAGGFDDGGGACCVPIVNFSYAFGRGR